MPNVLTDLRKWAVGLPYWEQAALDKIAAGIRFSDDDYEQLLQYLLEDAGLAEKTSERPELRFPKSSDDDVGPAEPIKLLQIANLQNINALVPDQTLKFGPALTAIYGRNGSGKSGYARVLGCAGFTRGDEKVLPDVTQQPTDDEPVLTADIDIADGDDSRTIHYQVGRECHDLASLYVFDSTSVHVHLTGRNTISFSPAGLLYLTRLAEATDQVRARRDARIEEYRQPHTFSALFEGQSIVRKRVDELGPTTDLDNLRELAALTQEELAQIGALDLQIAKLKLSDTSEQIISLDRDIADLQALVRHLNAARSALSKAKASEMTGTLSLHQANLAAAATLSVDQFKSEHFTQTGTDLWRRFVEAAKELADAEQADGEPYPREGSHCLLCQQPLTQGARELMHSLWAFLAGEAQTNLNRSRNTLDAHSKTLSDLDLGFFGHESVAYRYLVDNDSAVFAQVQAFVEAYSLRRAWLQQTLTGVPPDSQLPTLPATPAAKLEEIANQLQAARDDLAARDVAAEIAELENQERELEHRRVLSEHIDEVCCWVQRQAWANRATQVGGTTRHITTTHNSLFRRLVTDRYVELFEQTLKELECPLCVNVSTQGRKGEVLKQIVLKGAPGAQAFQATPDKVLSEGEKRAVALADFLTEVALDESSSGIVLDDPVTSLDLQWRKQIAETLAKQAKRRQVIVFTHDLPFLYFLKDDCEKQQVETAVHSIERGINDGRPGYVLLNNCVALEQEYRTSKRAHEYYNQACNVVGEQQQSLLRAGCAALRSSYEAFIVYDLFNGAVHRFDERIGFTSLKRIVWDDSVVRQVADTSALLSRYIEGHLHTDDLYPALTPQLLIHEISEFDAMKAKLNKLKTK